MRPQYVTTLTDLTTGVTVTELAEDAADAFDLYLDDDVSVEFEASGKE